MAKRKQKLPPYVVEVRGPAGRPRYRTWFPTGGSGKKRWLPVVDTPEEAAAGRAEAMRLVEALPVHLVTFGKAVEATRAELAATTKPDTLSWFADHAAQLEEALGRDTPLQGITPDLIERQVRDRRVGKSGRSLSPTTVQHRKRALSRVLRLAIRRGWLTGNPLDRTGGWPRVQQKRVSYFTPDEVKDLLRRIKASKHPDAEVAHDVVALAFLTGLRRSELARLRAEDVDLRGGTIHVSGKRRDESAPLGRGAHAVAKRMLKRHSAGYLIPGGPQGISALFRAWSVRLAEPRLTPHALRHGFVSALVAAGHDVAVVQRFSRHRSVVMLARYAHANPKNTEVLSTLDEALEP